MDMKSYLASKYMSGPKADAILARTAKKKKRKAPETSAGASGSFVRDEDSGWGEAPKDDDADEISEAVVAKDRGFKKRRMGEGSGWATVSGAAKEDTPPPDEQPMVVDEEPAAPFTGGLLTAKELKRALPKAVKKAEATQEEIEAAQETVYRDTTGRKIDVKAERAEAARKKREKEEKESQKMEWGKGLVQRKEKEQLKSEMENNRTKDFSRSANDVDMNAKLKAVERWDDPAAAFLTKKRVKGPRKPEYNGPTPPPNRFGIKPGYRWDGVDRGTGFEKKVFQVTNDKKRKGIESYKWSAEDM